MLEKRGFGALRLSWLRGLRKRVGVEEGMALGQPKYVREEL